MTEGTSERSRLVPSAIVRVSTWLAFSLGALCVAMFVAAGALSILAQSAQSPGNWVSTVRDTSSLVPFLAFPLVGALVAFRRPENSIGWKATAPTALPDPALYPIR